jgi:hypothetical protein
MNSYIIRTYRVTERIKKYVLDDLLKEYNTETQQFFCHVLFGTIHTIKRKKEGWVPVPSTTIQKHWGTRADIQIGKLQDSNLLEIRVFDVIELANGELFEITYNKTAGLCREFRVCLDVLDKISKHYPGNLNQYSSCQYYNLMTGKKMNKFKRHKLTDHTDHPIPTLVRNSMLSIKRCVVNKVNIEKFLSEKQKEIDMMQSFDPTNPMLQTLRRRFHHNQGCIDKVFCMSSGGKRLDNGNMEYYPSYEMQYSGRITEMGGGLQSASRELKKAAFSGISNLYNYDLKSSQVYGLIQWFEVANLDYRWLTQYLNRDKKDYADYVEVSVDCWKSLFLSLIMAAHLPTPDKVAEYIELKQFEESTDSLLRYISEEADSIKDAIDKYTRFYKIVFPLKAELDKWHNWLLDTYVPLSSVMAKGKQYISNKTGATFCLSDYKRTDGKWKNIIELKRRLAPFFLQGNEAAFIHHLTWVSEHYGYQIISNQHDGVVSLGKIPQEAIDYARESSGLKYAKLELKNFC